MRVEGDCASSFVRTWPKSLRRGAMSGPKTLRRTPRKGAFDLKLARHQIIMLVVMIFGTFVAVLNQTLVTPALPSIMTEMNVDAATAQWLTTGFTLVNAIMIPITAYLIDRYSTRNLFTVSMLIFTAGSALSGWGPNFPVLLAGRLLQAAGAGILMPMVMTVLMLTFPPERRGSAMGLFGIVIAFAPPLALRRPVS